MRFGILGPIEVADDRDRLLDLGPHRQRALLAILLLNANSTVSLDRLIDQLWGESPPGAATASLQAYISYLRRVLEPERRPRDPSSVLVTKAPGYSLRVDASQLDFKLFEQRVVEAQAMLGRDPSATITLVDEALSMWRGDPLIEFAGEAFAVVETERLRELGIDARELRLEALLSIEQHARVVREAEQLIAANPLRERLRWLLMIALYRSDRQAEALRAFEDARVMLATELGLEPGPALRNLQHAILNHDPALASPGPAAVLSSAHPVVTIAPAQFAVDDAPEERTFVGRDPVLAELLLAIDEVELGTTRFVLVGGEPGVGKTRLVTELERRVVRRGWTASWGRAHDEAGSPPLWQWVQVLRGIGIDALELDEGVRSTLAALLPELGATDVTAVDGDAARFRLFDAVHAALRAAAARQPVLVALDDLQWTDVSSLRLLRFLATECAGASIAIVATFHEPADLVPGGLGATLADLSRQPNVRRQSLDPLTSNDVRDLLESSLASTVDGLDALAVRLHARTNGNAFFLTELVRLLSSEHRLADAAGIPGVVGDVVRRRLQRLPDDVQAVLGIAAVVGREFDLEILRAVSGIDDERAIELMEAALVARIVVDAGLDRFRFAHGLVRDTIYQDFNATRRARLHGAIAQSIEALHDDDLDRWADQLAHHFGQTADVARARSYALRAAEVAERRWAYDEAAAYWRNAIALGDASLSIVERARLHLRLAHALRYGGQVTEALDVLHEALDLADASRDIELLADTAFSFGEEGLLQATAYGIVDQRTVIALGRLRERLTEMSEARARVLVASAVALYYDDTARPEARHLAEEAASLARGIGEPKLLAAVLSELLLIRDPDPDVDNIVDLVDETADALDALDPTAVAGPQLRVERMRLSLGDAGTIDETVEQSAALLAEARWPTAIVWAEWARAGVAFLRGDLVAAELHAASALSMHERLGFWGAYETFGLHMLFIWREQGRLAEMAPIVEPMLVDAVHPGAAKMRAMFAVARGDLEAVAGLLGADPVPRARDFPWLCELSVTAELAATAALPCAAEVFDLLEPYADRVATMDGTFVCLGSISHYLGLLAGALGRADGIEFLERGLAANDRIGAVPWSVRSRYALATALRAHDSHRARALLVDAHSMAASHGLTAMCTAIESAPR